MTRIDDDWPVMTRDQAMAKVTSMVAEVQGNALTMVARGVPPFEAATRAIVAANPRAVVGLAILSLAAEITPMVDHPN
jgi:hypothetical protein